MNSLEPHLSQETLEYHYGKHHLAYYGKLKAAIETDDSYKGKDLEFIVKNSGGGTFNNAAQIWNHSFYWNCLNGNGGGVPTRQKELATAIDKNFGSFTDFKAKYTASALGNFGSGWTWLV